MATNQTAIWAAVVPWSGVQNPPTASPNVLGLVQPNGVATDYLDGSGNWSVPPSGAGGVTQLTPGPGISLNPPGGVGIVEITATASGGNVTGPAGATSGNFAAFNGGTGLLLEDSGKSAASFLGATAEAADVNPSGTNIAAALAGKQAAGAAAGGDLGGNYPNPKVVAVTETGGPTDLVIGSVPDGTYLKRSGGTVIGGTPTGSGNVTGPSVSVDGDIAIYSGTSGEIIKDTGLKAASFDAAGAAATAQSNAETYAAAQAAAAQTAAEAYAANSSNQSSGTLNASRLPASGVSAGSYTNTNLTVDATGRITAANSGSAGSGLPAGGAIYTKLGKHSASNYDAAWYSGSYVDASDFLANGDTLQNAFNRACAINGTLLLPPGITALPSGGLVLPGGFTGSVGIRGCGKNVSLLTQANASNGVYLVTSQQPGNTQFNCEGFSVVSTNASGGVAFGVDFGTAAISYQNVGGNCTFRDINCYVTGSGSWTQLFYFRSIWYSEASGLSGTFGASPQNDGIVIDSCINFKLNQIELVGVNRGLYVTSGTGDVGNSQGINVNLFRVVSANYGIYSVSPIWLSNFMIDNGAAVFSGSACLYIGQNGITCGSCMITGGQILNAGQTYGIELNNSYGCMIQNVDFSNVSGSPTAHIGLTNTTASASIQACNFGTGGHLSVIANTGTSDSKAINNSYGATFTDHGSNFLTS